MLRSSCAVLLLIISTNSGLRAQASGLQLTGRITESETGYPIVSAFISIDSAKASAVTDDAGRFRINGVAAGTHTIHARRIGYAVNSASVTVSESAVASVEIELTPIASEVAGVTIIGSRSDIAETRQQLMRTPGGVSLITPDEIRSTRQANLKDVLGFTPGVFVQPRFGGADESQISIRGSGLRDNFHARGLNLLVNGMPYRNADGFTDFESLELLTTEAIEVYKGANALRYGGSTMGGAINLNTKTGYSAEPMQVFAQGGAFGFAKAQISSGGVRGRADYYASFAHTSLDGYRDWADQQRDRVNLHAGLRLSDNTDARAFYFYAKIKEHLPGALTADAYRGDPTAADAENASNRWGRDYDLHHIGAQLRTQLTPTQRLEISPYLQYRDIDHPIFEVIAQISRDVGAEIRYENTAPLGARANRLTLGFQPASENMDNRQFVNEAGQHGALTRDEKDDVKNIAGYVEDALSLSDRLTLIAGARVENSKRSVADHFLSNGDQSDSRTYSTVSPRAGVLYTLPSVNGALFANASSTAEPPLLLEMASFGNPGGFIDLSAQKAWQYEVGTRGRKNDIAWEASVFDIELRDELLNINVQPFPNAPFTIPTYRNAERTRHAGVEAGLAWRIRDRWSTRVAYTYGSFTYVKDSAYDGNDLPGAPAHHINIELKYEHPAGLSIAPVFEAVPGSYYLDSENTVKNDAWTSVGLRAEWKAPRLGINVFAEGRNLTDRRYSASTQVDNAAGAYYEPADSRALLLGVRWVR